MKKPFSSVEPCFDKFGLLYGENTDNQKQRYISEFERFKKSFGKDCAYVASSSGRVEVIGNHTDHNGGKVISTAISLDVLAMFLPTNDNTVTIKSLGYDDIVLDVKGEPNEKTGTSGALTRGVIVGLKDKGYKVGGFIATFTSNVIGGAGISSSAAFEVLVAEIQNFLYNDDKISKEDLAIVSQFSENVYFGKPCGLLDQTAIAFGGLNVLDFSVSGKIGIKSIDCNVKGFNLVLINTGGSHENLTGEFASITIDMKKVSEYFGEKRLIEVGRERFYNKIDKLYNDLPDRAILRAMHFFDENDRVDMCAKALNNNDYSTFIDCVKKSGLSSIWKLQNCFVNGADEQPILKALAVAENFLGDGANRVHGGGFAGTILNIVSDKYIADFLDKTTAVFGKKNVIPLRVREKGTIVL